MPKLGEDLTGMQFERLTVIKKSEQKKWGKPAYLCQCTCGKEVLSIYHQLVSGQQTSCGCKKKEVSKNIKKHAHKSRKYIMEEYMPTVCVEGTRLDVISPNTKIKKTNKSGVKGVHFEKYTQKWRASITFKGKDIKLGRFDRFEDAVQARKDAEDKYFKPILKKYNQV